MLHTSQAQEIHACPTEEPLTHRLSQLGARPLQGACHAYHPDILVMRSLTSEEREA